MGDSIEFEEVLGEEEATGNDSFTMKVFLDPDIQMTCPFLIFRIPFSFQSFFGFLPKKVTRSVALLKAR